MQVEGAPGALVVIISGPSGVGKDTIIDAMHRRDPERTDRRYVITCTTRARRDYEVDGTHYLFLTHERFAALREADGFLELAEVHGNWYGTPRDQVVDAITAGRDAILKIDVQGARAVRALIPEALLIFVVPPSEDELRARLKARNTESPEAFARRMANAVRELERQGEYDHVVTNETGQVDRTAEEIEAIIAREHALHPGRRLRV
ncbi:MAG: guanylate kinase [Chloroflexota bacterium]